MQILLYVLICIVNSVSYRISLIWSMYRFRVWRYSTGGSGRATDKISMSDASAEDADGRTALLKGAPKCT